MLCNLNTLQLACFAPYILCSSHILCSSSSSSSSLGQYTTPFTIQSWTMLPVMIKEQVRYHQLSINEHAPAKFCMSTKITSCGRAARPSVDAQVYTCVSVDARLTIHLCLGNHLRKGDEVERRGLRRSAVRMWQPHSTAAPCTDKHASVMSPQQPCICMHQPATSMQQMQQPLVKLKPHPGHETR